MRTPYAALAIVTGLVAGGPSRADDTADAILDKAVKAHGGTEKLGKVKAFHFEAKGVITLKGNDAELNYRATYQGIDHMRQDYSIVRSGQEVIGVNVVAGPKGWRKMPNSGGPLDEEALANQKRLAYLTVTAVNVLALKDKGFKLAAGGEEKVDDKPAVVLTVTGPDRAELSYSFDKESGLLVKQVAGIRGPQGESYKQETFFTEYKVMDGIKTASKVQLKHDGQKYMTYTIETFMILGKVEAKTFADPN